MEHLTALHSLFSLPRLVFPHQRKSKADDDIVFKQYVTETGVFHFGPLLCGKSRDWYVLPALSEHPDVLPAQHGTLGWHLQGLVLSRTRLGTSRPRDTIQGRPKWRPVWEMQGAEGPQMCELEQMMGK